MSFSQRLCARIFLGLLANGALISPSVAQTEECASASITLTTQAQVDDFQTNFGNGRICSVVTDSLRIQDSNISNLDGLSALTTVGGSLLIQRNTALSDLDGLNGITSVGRALEIWQNSALSNVDGLGAITSVGDSVIVIENSILANLDGLRGVTGGVGSVILRGNNALNNIDGLGGITGVERVVYVQQNNALSNIDGLGGITRVGRDVYIEGNSALTSIDGLGAITFLRRDLRITQNNALSTIETPSALPLIGGSLTIEQNNALRDIDLGAVTRAFNIVIQNNNALADIDLGAITRAFNLVIQNNNALATIDGLGELTTLLGDLTIKSNAMLSNIDGLRALTTVIGELRIESNARLGSIDSLGSLTSVEKSVVFIGNNSLTNIDGLSGLTRVGQAIVVAANNALINIDGFAAITFVLEDLILVDNNALNNIDALSGLTSVGRDLGILRNRELGSCAVLGPVLGWPVRPHDPERDLVGNLVTVSNNAAGAESVDDCLNAFDPEISVALFDQRQEFMEITDVQEASDPYLELSAPDEPYVSGQVAFSTGSQSSLNFADWPADFEGDNDIELALNGVEDLDIRSGVGPVFALGIDFDDESGGATPSTFTVTGLLNGGELFVFEFTTPPSGGRDFIGVRSDIAFDTLRIREVQAANENEYFGTVFTSDALVRDSDGDGLFDDRDSCDATPSNELGAINAEGCSPSERDTDGDGVNDNLDAFPLDPAEQRDSDGDGFGDNQEIDAGSDPNDARDLPDLNRLPAWLLYEASQ